MAALDASHINDLRGRVGRPRGQRTASPVFQELWDTLDRLRKEKTRMDEEAFANKCGFSRSSYFVYGNHGTAPFKLLERMAEQVKARISASVVTGATDLDLSDEQAPGGTMLDVLQPFLDLLQSVPEEHRDAAFGAMYTAAEAAVARLPFAGPSAAHGKARRGRGKR